MLRTGQINDGKAAKLSNLLTKSLCLCSSYALRAEMGTEEVLQALQASSAAHLQAKKNGKLQDTSLRLSVAEVLQYHSWSVFSIYN